MTIKSIVFATGQNIPVKHTCDDANISPPLSLIDIPSDAKSLCIIMDDPDAPGGTFVHWLLWNIPPETIEIPEGALDLNAVSGRNDFGAVGYGGPCPPSGTHRYFFRLYALDQDIGLTAGSNRKQLDDAMKDHIIASAELMGKYTRSL